MPVDLLLVEGEPDAVILGALLDGSPPVQQRGAKNALKPIAAEEWLRTGRHVAFVRDRDFDFDPAPSTGPMLGEIRDDRLSEPLGWYWARHEIESYLLDPSLVALVWPSVARRDCEEALVGATCSIRFYEAARWTIGIARRALPPQHELKMRPLDLGDRDLAVPSCLEEGHCREWALRCIGEYLNQVSERVSPFASCQTFAHKAAMFTDDFCADCESVLIWFSGKDLLAAMGPSLAQLCGADAGRFRADVRYWITKHPQETLNVLPGWQMLLAYLKK